MKNVVWLKALHILEKKLASHYLLYNAFMVLIKYLLNQYDPKALPAPHEKLFSRSFLLTDEVTG